MPEQPGLVETLRSKSRGSALIGIFQNGQLTWLSGTATGLTPRQALLLVLSSTLTNLDIFMKKITPAFNEAGGAPLHDRRRSFHLRMYFQRNQQNAEKAQEDSAHAREKVSALSARKSQALTWLDNQWINPVPVAQVSREKTNSSGLLHHAGKKRRDHSAGTGATYYRRMRHPCDHHA